MDPPLVSRSWSRRKTYDRQLRRSMEMDRFPVAQEGLLYHCALDDAKRRNLARQRATPSYLRRGEPALPHILHVGVTTLCNLHCPACPTGTTALGRPGEHLDFDLFRRVVDELRESLMFMLFWDWGEPLLHPRLPEMIRHAAESRIMTVISSNGSFANAKSRMEKLVEAGPSVLIVCVDGADQQTYEQYRVGGRLDRVMETLDGVVRAKQQLGTPYPVVEFRSLAMRQTQEQLPRLLTMAEDIGADLFSVKTMRPYDYRGHEIDEEMVPSSGELRRYEYHGVEGPSSGSRIEVARRGRLRCAKPHHAPTLNSDGELAFCSYARYPLESFGTLEGTTFRGLWSDKRSRGIRRRFQRFGGSRACMTCYFRNGQSPTIIHQVPLRPFPGDITARWPESRDEFLRVVSG